MTVTTRLLLFGVALIALFAGAAGIGRAVGPVESSPTADHGDMDGDADDLEHAGMEKGGTDATALPKGLMVTQNGYTFRLAEPTAAAGDAVPVEFTIEGPDGTPVTQYDVEHEEDLHLIAVRRDFSGFQHVHPEMAEDGSWRTDLDLTAGQWRLFADFKATGADALTLGNDLAVRGSYRPTEPSSTDSLTSTVDGYTVTLDGDLVAGEEAELTLTVTREGEPVTDLEPYLGAYGHLVALRAGDLAYLHVHPEGAPGDGTTEPGPEVVFFAEVPSTDRYHLYLDFKHEGVVRTAAFNVTGSSEPASEDAHAEESEDRATTTPATDTDEQTREHQMTALTQSSDSSTSTSQVELEIMGMTCASCANRIERKLNKIDGVVATVNYATEKAKVVFPEDLDPVELVKTVESAGYSAALPRPDQAVSESGEGTVDDPTRSLRERLVISAVLTVPVIALAMVPAWQFTYWQWLSLTLATPVVVWGAWPFHRAAWVNLKHGTSTMDTLVSLGTLAALGWSLYALFWGTAGVPGMTHAFELTVARSDGSGTSTSKPPPA